MRTSTEGIVFSIANTKIKQKFTIKIVKNAITKIIFLDRRTLNDKSCRLASALKMMQPKICLKS